MHLGLGRLSSESTLSTIAFAVCKADMAIRIQVIVGMWECGNDHPLLPTHRRTFCKNRAVSVTLPSSSKSSASDFMGLRGGPYVREVHPPRLGHHLLLDTHCSGEGWIGSILFPGQLSATFDMLPMGWADLWAPHSESPDLLVPNLGSQPFSKPSTLPHVPL